MWSSLAVKLGLSSELYCIQVFRVIVKQGHAHMKSSFVRIRFKILVFINH